jgi:hypothetical protein
MYSFVHNIIKRYTYIFIIDVVAPVPLSECKLCDVEGMVLQEYDYWGQNSS